MRISKRRTTRKAGSRSMRKAVQHTLAGLGKGKYRSAVAKCISEAELGLEAKAFDTGVFGDLQGASWGRAVAVKVPPIKNKGLEVSEHTLR